MIECKLCGVSFSIVGGVHLTQGHGITVKEYLERFPGAPLYSTEYLQNREKYLRDPGYHEKQRKACTERWTPEERELMSQKITSAYENNQEFRAAVSDGGSEGARRRWSTPGAYEHAAEVTSRTAKAVWDSYTPEEKLARLRNSVLSPESMQASHENTRKGVSAVEEHLNDCLEDEYSGKFVWNRFTKEIGCRYPDFYFEELKLVIECFGEWWHGLDPDDEELKKEHYKRYGWDCIVVWANKPGEIDDQWYEIKDEIDKRVLAGEAMVVV
jgi:very-short-patch-repair endonuclease